LDKKKPKNPLTHKKTRETQCAVLGLKPGFANPDSAKSWYRTFPLTNFFYDTPLKA
jgi:hypothetical protein